MQHEKRTLVLCYNLNGWMQKLLKVLPSFLWITLPTNMTHDFLEEEGCLEHLNFCGISRFDFCCAVFRLKDQGRSPGGTLALCPCTLQGPRCCHCIWVRYVDTYDDMVTWPDMTGHDWVVVGLWRLWVDVFAFQKWICSNITKSGKECANIDHHHLPIIGKSIKSIAW